MTNVSRRRFLKISAVMGAYATLSGSSISVAKPIHWRGVVMGADASITLYGDESGAKQAIDAALEAIRKHKKQLSIYDQHSDLSRLNQSGFLNSHDALGKDIFQVTALSEKIHGHSNGLFDPTVQPLFELLVRSNGVPHLNALKAVQDQIGFEKVQADNKQISFSVDGMAMTFNGIAQGFITDKVRQSLDESGFTKALVNIGEYSAGERPANIGIADADGSIFEVIKLTNKAIATSSHNGYRFKNGASHILRRDGKNTPARWDTVSVIANSAAEADGYSTALSLTMDTNLAEKLVAAKIIEQVVFKDRNGKVHRI